MKMLEEYISLLRRWQKAVNLVAESTLADVWRRHVWDSAQLIQFLERQPSRIIDLGSGAGFPGLVLAILGAGSVDLVESDSRKCAFLREVIRVTGVSANVHETRIQQLARNGFDVVTSRALASLSELLGYALPLLAPWGVCLFLKGRRIEEELTDAVKEWKMTIAKFPSQTGPDGWVIRVGDIRRVRPDR